LTKELLDDDQSINPTRYKILIRIGDEELYLAGLVENICFKQILYAIRPALFTGNYDPASFI
jgi:hypothetical protein